VPQNPAVPAEGVAEIVTFPMPATSAEPFGHPPSPPPTANLPAYAPYAVNRTLGTQDDFYRLSSDHRIREVIADVVQ
jgi:hypothetical protein